MKLEIFKSYINKLSNDLEISRIKAFDKLIELNCFSELKKNNASELEILESQLVRELEIQTRPPAPKKCKIKTIKITNK